MKDFALVPSPQDDGFVELSASTSAATRKATGRVFRKQILHYGDLRYPGVKGGKVKVDEEFADTLIKNFHEVGDIVHAPKAGARNEHTDDPDRNVGEVIDVVKTDKGVFVDIDVRTDDADKMGKTLLGASALMHLDYTDRKTGQKVGPALLHTCITNRPYVTDLEPFQEVLAMSAGEVDILTEAVVLTPESSKEDSMPTKEEAIARLAEDGIDVAALQTAQSAHVALTSAIQSAFGESDVIALSASGEVSQADVIAAVNTAAEKIVELSAEIRTRDEEALQTEAVNHVEKLALTGHILPKNKEAMVTLFKEKRELFDQLVPDQPLVNLSVENGDDPADTSDAATRKDEIDRLVALSDNLSASA